MLPSLLLLAGGAVALYCLWQFRRWLGEPAESGPAGSQRLEVLIDELVATAEATSAVVQERADALTGLIAEADRRIGALAAPPPAVAEVQAPAVAPPAPAQAVPAPEPVTGPPEAHRQVYALADAGHDVTAIARRLGLTKGEVLLILGIRK